MVERVESQGLNSFEGVVKSVELQPATEKDRPDQYKITMQTPASKKSGFMYEWVNLTETTSDEKVPEGSNIDKYLQEVEAVLPEAKKKTTIGEALKLMVGHKFKFVRKKLGKSFKGKEAKEFWVPQSLLE